MLANENIDGIDIEMSKLFAHRDYFSIKLATSRSLKNALFSLNGVVTYVNFPFIK
jgi:hypothetical protein